MCGGTVLYFTEPKVRDHSASGLKSIKTYFTKTYNPVE